MMGHFFNKAFRWRTRMIRPRFHDPQGPSDKPETRSYPSSIQEYKILTRNLQEMENVMTSQALKTKLQATSAVKLFMATSIMLSMTLPAFAAIENTAQVSGSTPDGGTVSDTSTETITIQSASPSFTIAKSVASVSNGNGSDLTNPDGGDIITYSYQLANTGNVSIDGATVSITDPGPEFDGNNATNSLGVIAYVSGDADTDNNVDVGETWLYQATYTLSQTDVDNSAGVADGVSNTVTTASAVATGAFGAATFQSGSSTLTATTTIPENGSLSLAKIATRDGVIEDDGSVTGYNTGETVTYRLTVTNNGNVTMSTMTVSETAFDGAGGLGSISAISCNTSLDATIATLAPGASEVCTATYVIQEADL